MSLEQNNQKKNLSNLSPAPGSNVKKKRLGRGIGSGLGKTAARGGKGQTARKGGGIRAGFEGGQTPLYRRLPKRGFTSLSKTQYNCVDVAHLNKFSAGSLVTKKELDAIGLIRNSKLPLKILGSSPCKVGVRVEVSKISKAANDSIVKAGGSVSIKE
ncbi:MAG: 50S ribosomal protein L15 [Proteobacteria bacterium]|nr:50S ribosomal protein L15 [Pseudomonadota bacterium]